MIAAAIRGPKKSGKTAVTGLLAEALERQKKRVAIVKYSSHPVDLAVTDSFWLMRPGRTVVAASGQETAIFYSRELPLERIIPLLDADVLLVEGGSAPSLPAIWCSREDDEEGPVEPDTPVLARVGEGDFPPAPAAFSELTPEAAAALADLVLEKGLDVTACPPVVLLSAQGPVSLSSEAQDRIRRAVAEASGLSLDTFSLEVRLGVREGA